MLQTQRVRGLNQNKMVAFLQFKGGSDNEWILTILLSPGVHKSPCWRSEGHWGWEVKGNECTCFWCCSARLFWATFYMAPHRRWWRRAASISYRCPESFPVHLLYSALVAWELLPRVMRWVSTECPPIKLYWEHHHLDLYHLFYFTNMSQNILNFFPRSFTMWNTLLTCHWEETIREIQVLVKEWCFQHGGLLSLGVGVGAFAELVSCFPCTDYSSQLAPFHFLFISFCRRNVPEGHIVLCKLFELKGES